MNALGAATAGAAPNTNNDNTTTNSAVSEKQLLSFIVPTPHQRNSQISIIALRSVGDSSMRCDVVGRWRAVERIPVRCVPVDARRATSQGRGQCEART